MYKVLVDNTLVCDSRIEELALINPVVKLEENKAGSFSFKIPPGHPYYDTIRKRKTIVEVYLDDEKEPVFCGMCTKEDKDLYNQKNISCEGDMSFLNDSIQRPRRYQGYTVRGLLEAYIANHNAQVEESKRFVVGVVTVTDPNDYISCYTNMESTMKAIKEDLVDDLGGIIRIRHENGVRYIDYLSESPNTNSQVIKLGKNLVDFKSNIDSVDIATAVIPLGEKLEESTVDGLETRLTIAEINGGNDYVYNQEAVNAYGWIYKTVTFDGVTTPEALKRKGGQYLSEVQYENVVIEAKAVDLNLTDKSQERFKISDQIRVVSAPHGLNKYFRLTKQTLNLNSPEKDKITLGKNEKTSLSAKSNQVSEEVKKAVESIVPPNHILTQAVQNATALITTAMGGYVVKTNNELLIMDTDDIETATKVWRWNINGLGYSSTGYKGPYSLAMTMDGKIMADFVYGSVAEAKTVKVENLTGDTFEGFNIKGCNIMSESELYKALLYGATFYLNKGEEQRVAIFASVADENDTGVIVLKSSNGNEVFITADGITYNNAGSGGQWGYINIPGKLTAKGMELQDGITAGGGIDAGGGITAGDGITTNGGIDAQDNITTKKGITAQGDITGNNVYAYDWLNGKNAQIAELIISKYAILSEKLTTKDAEATNNVTVGNDITVTNDVTVDHDITAGNNITVGNNITAENAIRGETVICNQMGIGGGAEQYVEWVWNGDMARWVLCTI